MPSIISFLSYGMAFSTFTRKDTHDICLRWKPDATVPYINKEANQRYVSAILLLNSDKPVFGICSDLDYGLTVFIMNKGKKLHSIEHVLWGSNTPEQRYSYMRKMIIWHDQHFPNYKLTTGCNLNDVDKQYISHF